MKLQFYYYLTDIQIKNFSMGIGADKKGEFGILVEKDNTLNQISNVSLLNVRFSLHQNNVK